MGARVSTDKIFHVSTDKISQGRSKWGDGVAVGGRAVFAPQNANCLLIFDPTDDSIDAISTEHIATGENKWSAGAAVDNKAVFAPLDSDSLLIFDSSNSSLKSIDIKHIPGPAKAKWQAGAAVSGSGKAVFAPKDMDVLLIFNTRDESIKTIDTTGIAKGKNKWGSGTEVDGKLVFAPAGANADQLLIFDPTNDSIKGVSTKDVDTGEHKWRAATTVCGKAIFAPLSANHVLVYDPKAELVHGISTKEIESNKFKFRSAAHVDGRAVFAPASGELLLIFDPADDSMTSVSTKHIAKGKDSKWRGGVFVGGKAVFAPDSADCLIFCAPNADLLPVLRPALPQASCVEVVSASLSNWIYGEDAASETPVIKFGDTRPVDISVHEVVENIELGSQVKVAMVTADHADLGKTLFIVFKGTSYLEDFIKWDFSRNYKFTGDKNAFAHAGGSHVIDNFIFFTEQEFMERAEEAADNGVTQLVITGHSLGGIYANVLLHELYQKRGNVGPAKDLLASTKVVTFGAPMAFGKNADDEPREAFKDFTEYMHSRSTNFINGNDPCPRAWSKIDLKKFISKAAQMAGKGLKEAKGYIAGGTAAKVLDGAVEQLLARRDLDKIVKSAANFEHFSALRLLVKEPGTTNHWAKDHKLTTECFVDHNMSTYLQLMGDPVLARFDENGDRVLAGDLRCLKEGEMKARQAQGFAEVAMRNESNPQGTMVATIPNGESLMVLAGDDGRDYVKVNWPEQMEGYVRRENLISIERWKQLQDDALSEGAAGLTRRTLRRCSECKDVSKESATSAQVVEADARLDDFDIEESDAKPSHAGAKDNTGSASLQETLREEARHAALALDESHRDRVRLSEALAIAEQQADAMRKDIEELRSDLQEARKSPAPVAVQSEAGGCALPAAAAPAYTEDVSKESQEIEAGGYAPPAVAAPAPGEPGHNTEDAPKESQETEAGGHAPPAAAAPAHTEDAPKESQETEAGGKL